MDAARLKEIFAKHHVRLAVMFGSRARGSSRPSSDFDVAVEGEVDTIALAAALSDAVLANVDVVDLDRLSYSLRNEVLRDGKVVYEERHGVAAQWRTRAILEDEADRPLFERMQRAYLARVAARGIL